MFTELVTLCRDLVALPSVNPQGRDVFEAPYGEGPIADFVYNWFSKNQLEAVIQEVGAGRCSVLAQAFGRDRSKTLVLCAHLDTVDVQDMRIKPFDPVISDGKLYGRGSCDTKGSLAAMMMAFRARAAKGNLPYNLALLASCGEEYDHRGADFFVQQGAGSVGAVVVGEPTGLRVVTAHKGVVRLQLTTRGRSAHSSTPQKGENAIVSMVEVLKGLEGITRQIGNERDDRLGHETLALTVLQGGQQINVIPDVCRAFLDWRLLPGKSAQDCREAFCRMLAAESSQRVDVELVSYYAGMSTDEGHPMVKKLVAAAGTVTQSYATDAVHYATDAGSFAPLGIPTPVLGPGDIAQAHSAEEFIETAELEKGQAVYEAFLDGNWGLLPAF